MMWARKNELMHHGILGQKWGVRNGKTYPLSSSQHSAAEKKAILESYKGKELSENKKAADKLAAKRTKYETKYNDTNKERYKKKAGQRQSSNVRVSYNRNVAKNVDPFYIPSAERKKMRKEMDRLNKKISADPNKASKKDAERFLVLYTAMQNHEKVKKQVESHSRKKR